MEKPLDIGENERCVREKRWETAQMLGVAFALLAGGVSIVAALYFGHCKACEKDIAIEHEKTKQGEAVASKAMFEYMRAQLPPEGYIPPGGLK
jgi:hypothetical protein